MYLFFPSLSVVVLDLYKNCFLGNHRGYSPKVLCEVLPPVSLCFPRKVFLPSDSHGSAFCPSWETESVACTKGTGPYTRASPLRWRFACNPPPPTHPVARMDPEISQLITVLS